VSAQIAALPLAVRLLAYTLLGLGVLGGWWFVIRYTRRYAWWRNEFGSHIVAFSAAVAMFYTYYMALTIWPELPGRSALRLILFTALTGIIVWRVVIFERVAGMERREKRDAATG